MRRPAKISSIALMAGWSLVSACGVDGQSHRDEPIVVHNATFYAGELPGEPPVAPGSDIPRVPPSTSSGTPNKAQIVQGMGSVNFTGQATDDAVSVAVRFDGVGTGYWLLPTLYKDAQTPDTLVWTLDADIGHALDAGTYRMLTVAFDEEGNAGTQSGMLLCINSLVPDNGNACNEETAPPGVVFSLEWDNAADLDLALVLPDGQVIDWRAPVSGEPDESGNIDLSVPGVGKLQRDSNGDCSNDGRQREDIVFQAMPPAGNYLVYANLNRACGEHEVIYQAHYHVRTRDGDTFAQNTRSLGAGTLLPRQAGVELGTFVGEVTVN